MKKETLPKLTSITFGVLVLCFLIGFYAFAAWVEPTEGPPEGNVEVPINVGPDDQTKAGQLGIGGLDTDYALTADISGKAGIKTVGGIWVQGTATSTDFCLSDGTACLSTTGGGAPTNASYVVLGTATELTGERVLKGGAGLLLTDGRAEGNVTLDVGAGTGISVATDTISIDTTWADTRYIQNVIANKGLRRDGSNNFGIINCSTNQIMKYNASAQWVCAADASGAGVTALGDLSDVSLVAPAAGEVLKYNGTSWVDDTDTNNYVNGINFNTTNGILTLTRSGLIDLTQDLDGRYLTSYTESDPQVGLVTSGQWCRGDGSAVQCNQSPPLTTASDYGRSGVSANLYEGTTALSNKYLQSESDPQVGLVTSGKWCRGDGSAVQCDQSVPGVPSNNITGSGSSNYLAKFTGTYTLGDSGISDDGTNVTVYRHLRPSTFDTKDLGSSNYYWRRLWILELRNTGAIYSYGDLWPGDSSVSLGNSSNMWSIAGIKRIYTLESPNTTVHGDLIPTSNNWYWLGNPSYKWNAVYATNYYSSPIPTVELGIEVIKKIKSPKLMKGDAGERYYFPDEYFPEEMKIDSEIEHSRILGVTLQTVREIIDKVEKLEKKVEELESR